jgi:hypothetical protein
VFTNILPIGIQTPPKTLPLENIISRNLGDGNSLTSHRENKLVE